MQICPNCFAQENDNAKFCGLCGKPLVGIATEENPLIGSRIDEKYVVQELIARGGMGEVYLGEHASLGQKVAVKILHKRYKGDTTVVMRFFNEAKSYCRVSHPNAVKLHDFGQLDDGTLYMIMEFVPGETLTAHLARKGPLGTRRTTQLGLMLADVLLAAHQQGVIHRDLKPDNIMLQEVSRGRYQLKVLDFGIAKVFDEATGDQLTETGMVFGTPEFMSPEQAQGFDVDERTDVYAFGMLLYYMITANLPFHGGAKLSILNRQVHEAPKRPSELAPALDIDGRIEAVIMKCLEKKRRDRYLDFDAVLADLERVAAGAPPLLGKTPREAGHDEVTVSGAQISYASAPSMDVVEKKVRGSTTDQTVTKDPLQAMFDAAAAAEKVTVVRDLDGAGGGRGPDAETRVARDTGSQQTVADNTDATRRVGPVSSSPRNDGTAPRESHPSVDTGPHVTHSDPRVLGTMGFGDSQPMIMGGAAGSDEGSGPSVLDSQPLESLSPLDRGVSVTGPESDEPILLVDASRPGAPVDEDVATGEQPVVDDDAGFSMGGEDDGFVMSIGEFDEETLSRPDIRPDDRRSSAPIIGLVLTILIAIGVVWFLVLRDRDVSVDVGPKESTSPLAEVTVPTGLVEPEDVVDVEVDDTAPLPPGARVDVDVRRYAIVGALAKMASTSLEDGDFEATAKLLERIDERPGDPRERQKALIEALAADLEVAEGLVKDAKKRARKLDCDDVFEAADAMEKISHKAAVDIRTSGDKCKSKRAKPPSRVE